MAAVPEGVEHLSHSLYGNETPGQVLVEGYRQMLAVRMLLSVISVTRKFELQSVGLGVGGSRRVADS